MIFGIVIIYFIGKKFYDLADKYSKNNWLYAILGVLTYYAGGFLFTFLLALLDVLVFEWGFDWESRYGMNLLAIPSGILALLWFYHLLEKKWKNSQLQIVNEIEDIGKTEY